MPNTIPRVFDLNLYIRGIERFTLLTAEEEVELAKKIQMGDFEARDKLIKHNLRLVVNIARQYAAGHRSLPDLINEGNLGLMHAAARFKPDQHGMTRFSTYASWWIKQSIRNHIKNTQWPVRIPAYMHTLIAGLRRYGITDPSQLDTPEGIEILQKVRKGRTLKKSTVHQAKRGMYAISLGLLDQAVSSEGDMLQEQGGPTDLEGLEVLVSREDESDVAEALRKLDDREQAVVSLRFGLGGSSPLTLREVGEKMGITRERVRQIETHAIEKLRNIFKVAI